MKRTSAPRLFFAYAHPCGDVLVNRGTMQSKELELLRSQLRAGKKVTADPIVFRKGFTRFMRYAKARRKRMTGRLVSEYFLTRHNRVVKQVAKSAKDVKPARCFISPGKITRLDGKKARVSTPFGSRNIIIGFVPKLKLGDLVSVHYNYACERIPKKDFERLWSELE